MKTPIIMVAFGTSSKATETYRYLDKKIRAHFADHGILWAFSSRKITTQLKRKGDKQVKHPGELLCQLARKGHKLAIVQSLHLLPGTESESLIKTCQKADISCLVGAPILSTPDDFLEICQLLQPLISPSPQVATLVLGHGTDHSGWTSYYCLEKFLRQRYGSQVFVGVVEKQPNSEHLVDEIVAAGYSEVHIIPLFLVAGMHYKRDIVGDEKSSWQSRLQRKNIRTKTISQGLGLLPGFEKIIIRHVDDALKKAGLSAKPQ